MIAFRIAMARVLCLLRSVRGRGHDWAHTYALSYCRRCGDVKR